MASPAEEGEAEAPEAGIEQARLNLVVTETGTANLHYEVGVLPLADGFRTTSIICIAVVAERLLVCLPFEVWSRKPADRLIHQRGLGKPLAVSLVSVPFDDRENPEGGFLKAWVGLLSEDLEATIEFGSDQDADVSFSPLADGQAIPYAPSLLEVANERFTFLSAESGAALGEGGAGGGALINGGGAESSQQGVTEARVAALEATLGSIQASLAALAKQPGAEKDAPGRKSALRRTRGDKAPAQSEMHVSFPGLDPAITQAALASGVGSAQLSEVSAILRNQPKRMEDLPRPSAASRRNELSESEDDEEEDDGHEDGSRSGSGDGSVAKAIVKLTKVCSALAEQKKKGGDHIENLLDQANMGGASSDAFGSGGSRKNAQALRALKRCLIENPEFIYKSLEANLMADFTSRPTRPGDPMGSATVRGWLESRSRVQNYTNHVRWMWSVGGIWDALIRGDVGGARARAALLIAAGDQASIDGGSWLLSNVSLLESPPPYHSFASHSTPSPQELQHFALFDTRWVELFLSHVKELDSYQETRRKLSKQAPRVEVESSSPSPKAKPKPKPKGAGKGKDKAEKHEKSAEAETASP